VITATDRNGDPLVPLSLRAGPIDRDELREVIGGHRRRTQHTSTRRGAGNPIVSHAFMRG
jgi:hypothetical protein